MRPLDVVLLVAVIVGIVAFAVWHASYTDSLVHQAMMLQEALNG